MLCANKLIPTTKLKGKNMQLKDEETKLSVSVVMQSKLAAKETVSIV